MNHFITYAKIHVVAFVSLIINIFIALLFVNSHIFLESGLHDYIIKLTNVKSFQAKVKYYNALVHDGKQKRQIV